MVILEYCEPVDKSFSPQAFYEGKFSSEISNPRDIYNKMVSAKNNSVDASKCSLDVTYLKLDDDTVWHPVGSNPDIAWPVQGAATGSFDSVDAGAGYNIDSAGNMIESDAEVHGYKHWYLWANTDNNKIVSPWAQVKFLNANVDDDSSIISIIAVGGEGTGNETRWLEVRNVKNWFCHMSSAAHENSHTTRIGANPDEGAPEVLGDIGQGFAILGVADKNTYIVGMRKLDGSTEEEISPYYVFHPEGQIGLIQP